MNNFIKKLQESYVVILELMTVSNSCRTVIRINWENDKYVFDLETFKSYSLTISNKKKKRILWLPPNKDPYPSG